MMVVLRSHASVIVNGLRAWAVARLERYKLPDEIHFVYALPLGRTGKADRRAAASQIEVNSN